MGRDAGKNEEGEMNDAGMTDVSRAAAAHSIRFHVGRLQNQGQEDIGRNLHLPQGVNERIALVAPEVPVVAGHKPIKIEEDGLPIPEPPITD